MNSQIISKIKHALALSITFALLLSTSAAASSTTAEVIDVYNINKPQTFINKQQPNKSLWFAYEVPAQADTRSMCCWKGGYNSHADKSNVGCDLNQQDHYGYGSSSDSPLTETITVYARINNQGIDQLFAVGAHCPVSGDNINLHWLHDVSEDNSISWLTQLSAQQDKDRVASSSIAAMAYHNSVAATKSLYSMALQRNDNNRQQCENAIFWLSQRNDGFNYLSKLYSELPIGERRKKINFALSQHSDPGAKKLLKEIALNDKHPDQRSDALFWMTQEDKENALPVLLSAIENESSGSVKEQAVFALSQLHSSDADEELLKLAQSHSSSNVREKALFWLAQNSPLKAKDAALAILSTDNPESAGENAVFVLSQLPQEMADGALFDVIYGEYSKSIKKKALFWLSQSEHPETLRKITETL